jgi:hypothetical protein
VSYEKTARELEKKNKMKQFQNAHEDIGKKPKKPSDWSVVMTTSKQLSGGRSPGTAPLVRVSLIPLCLSLCAYDVKVG